MLPSSSSAKDAGPSTPQHGFKSRWEQTGFASTSAGSDREEPARYPSLKQAKGGFGYLKN